MTGEHEPPAEQPQPMTSPDGLWWWNGQQWLPTARQTPRRTFKMTPLRWVWLVWCILWVVFWTIVFWPVAPIAGVFLALVAVRTKKDDARDRLERK